MFNNIFTSRLFVPAMIIVYGLYLLGLRIITLESNDGNVNILLGVCRAF